MVDLVKHQAEAEGAGGMGYLEHGDVKKMEEQLQKLRRRGGVTNATTTTVAAAAGEVRGASDGGLAAGGGSPFLKVNAPAGAAASGADAGVAPRLAASMAEANLEVLKAQGRLDAREAAERIIGLFLAAVDTTRYFLYVTMIILSELPEEVEKLKEEQQEVRGKGGGCGE